MDPKGYLKIETQAEFQKPNEIEDFLDPDTGPLPSFISQGWYEITHLIPDNGFVKISAGRNRIKIEAKINVIKNVPHGDNGIYEISGGLFFGNGIFRNVARRDQGDSNFQAKDSDKFTHFLICHSVKAGSSSLLRWRIVLQDF